MSPLPLVAPGTRQRDFTAVTAFQSRVGKGSARAPPDTGLVSAGRGPRSPLDTCPSAPHAPPAGSPRLAAHHGSLPSHGNRTRHHREREKHGKAPKPQPKASAGTRSGQAGASPVGGGRACRSECSGPGCGTLSLSCVAARPSSRVDCFLGPNSRWFPVFQARLHSEGLWP